MFTQSLLPLLKNAKNNENVTKIVNLSARIGSISDNQ